MKKVDLFTVEIAQIIATQVGNKNQSSPKNATNVGEKTTKNNKKHHTGGKIGNSKSQ